MTCTICQHHTERNYHKGLMGGVPGIVCWFCFLAWYELGLTMDVSIRQESIRSRELESTLKEPQPLTPAPARGEAR